MVLIDHKIKVNIRTYTDASAQYNSLIVLKGETRIFIGDLGSEAEAVRQFRCFLQVWAFYFLNRIILLKDRTYV